MFKYWSLKKYGNKLLPLLEKHYGTKGHYSASEVRTIVYQKDFDPTFLPLGYILFLSPEELEQTINREFPDINIHHYKKDIRDYLEQKSYRGYLQVLQ